MNNPSQKVKMKPVFPALYFVVFLNAVYVMFKAFVASTPPIIDAVIGESNRQVVLGVIYIFAFVLCVYDVIYYARLEIFEHHEFLNLHRRSIVMIIEFLIRSILICIVALKVFKYALLDDVFLFSFAMCLLLCIWHIFLKLFSLAEVNKSDIFLNLLVLALAFPAMYFSASPDRQIENAMLLLILSLIGVIVLSASVILLTTQFGQEFYNNTRAYLFHWRNSSQNS